MSSLLPLPQTSNQNQLVIYGQVVVGPPGSGKSTYCHAMAEFLRRKFGQGNVKIVNLDPGNDLLPADKKNCDLDVCELITVEDVMDRLKLGPNGSLLYCMKFLDENFQAGILDKIPGLFSSSSSEKSKVTSTSTATVDVDVTVDTAQPCWILFDMPGQVELYTHVESVKSMISKMEKADLRLCCLNFVDSHYCSDPGKYIACLLTCLNSMLHIALPFLNILSKIDLAEKWGKLPFSLDYYTEVLDLEYLVDCLDQDPLTGRYKSLNSALATVVENYGLVSFLPLDVQNEKLMAKVAQSVDKCVGRFVS